MNRIRETAAQIRLTDEGGMSLCLGLSDGRFIMVDGGEADKNDSGSYDDNARVLLGYLKRHSVGKPRIACWFFTHFHFDHIDLATRFLYEMKDEIEVDFFAYNNPGHDDFLRDPEREEELFSAMRLYDGAQIHELVTGEKLCFADTTVDVYLTESNKTHPYSDQNGISAAFAFTFSTGKRFTVFGDCSTERMTALRRSESEVYRSDEELKTDVIQIAHHGLTMGKEPYISECRELYRVMAPTVALYPISDIRYATRPHFSDEKYVDNKFILSTCKCYTQSRTTVVYMDTLEVIIEDI